MATPTITSLDLTTGNTLGGLLVTVTGTNLGDAVSAKFGGTQVAVVGTPTATTAKFRTPKKTTTGAVSLIVTNTSSGDSAATPNAFTYTKPPYGGTRGPNGAVVAPEDVYTQGDSVSSAVRPAVLGYQTAQVQTQGSLGGMLGAVSDAVGLQRGAVVFGHPDEKALQSS